MKPRSLENQLPHLTLAISAALSTHAHTASLTWDGNGTTSPNPNGGAGTWEAVVSNLNWWNGSENVTWPATGTDNDAIFANGGGSVTIAGAGGVAVNDIAFNSAGYTLGGTGITFNGSNPTIINSAAATINAPISGSVTKTGAANLSVGILNPGATLVVNQGAVLGNTGGGIGGNLQINGGATFSSSAYHIFQRPGARVHINGGTLTNANEFYLPAGTSAADPGVQMTGGTWSGGDQRFDSGAVAHIRINPASTTATLSAQLRHYQTGTQTYNVVGGTVPNGVDLLCSGSIAGNFNATGPTHVTKTGSGLMEITGTPVLQNNGILNLNGGTLRLTGTNAITNFGTASSSLALDAANPVTLQLNAANAGDSLTFSKNITGGSVNATVSKTGPGTVTLTGSKGYAGATTVQEGRLYQNATFTTPPAVTVAAGGTLGGTSTAGNVTIAHGGTLEGGRNGSGMLTAGNVTAGSLAVDAVTLKGTMATGITPLTVTNLTLNGGNQTVAVNATGTGLTNGTTYDVLVSANPITAPNASSVLAALKPVSRSFTPVVDGTGTRIQVTYNVADSVYWTGASGTTWDTSSLNWKLTTSNADTAFYSSDNVLFHDSPVSDIVDISSGNVTPASVTFDNTGVTTYTVSGGNGIAGSATLSITGGGKVILANSNSYTGATTVGAGSTLQLGNATANGSPGAASTITNNGTLAIVNSNGDQSQGTHFSGTAIGGALYKSGSGKLTLTAANTFSAATVSQGTLQINNAAGGGSAIILGDASTGDENVTLAANATTTTAVTASAANTGGGTVTIQQPSNYTSLNGPLTLDRATTILTTASDRAGIQGKISGSGHLTFSGSRTTMEQTAGNASDFTGDVTIASGTVQMNTTYGLPATASVDVQSGATFRANAGALIDGLSGTGTVHNNTGGGASVFPLSLGNSGGDGAFSGTIQNGSGTDIIHIIKNGAGTQEFAGANIKYTGATTLDQGKLVLTDTASFASSGIAMSDTNPATLTLNQTSGSKTFSNITGGASALAHIEKTGAGTVVLTGSSFAGSASDALLVSEGALFVNASLTAPATVSGTLGGTGTVGNVHVNDGATLAGGQSGGGTLATGNLTIGSVASDDAVIAGTLAAGVTPVSAQALTLNGGNGSVLLNATGTGLTNGTYYDVLSYTSISAPNASSPQAAFTTTSRAYSPFVDTVAKKVKLYYDANQGLYWTGTGSTEWSSASGLNNWKLNGTNAVTDFLANDVVVFDNRATNTTVEITEDVLPISTTIDNDAAHPYLIDGPAFGIASGVLAKTGAGTAVISSWNTYAGGTTISGGVLEAAVPEALGSGGVITMDGGTLRYGGTNTADYSDRLRVNDDKTAVIDTNGQNVSFASAMATGVSGTGAFKKIGPGILTLGNAATVNNSYSGGSIVSAGTLRLDGGSSGYCAGTGTITLGDADTPAEGATLAIHGAGTWGLSGADRWVQNAIAVAATGPGSGPLVISRPAGTYAAVIRGSIQLANHVTLRNNTGDRLSIEGKITGTGNVTVEGSQRVSFDHTGNDYLGTTTVASGGFLQLNYNNVLPAASDVTVNGMLGFQSDQATVLSIASLSGNGSVDLPYGTGSPVLTIGADGASHDADFAGVIKSRLLMTKTGDCTQVLSGANTYTGATVIDEGKLMVNGSTAAGSAVTVSANGTLGGSGTVSGATVVNGTLAPGAGVGSLFFGSTVSLAAGSNCAVEISGATTHDKIIATNGGVAANGTITVATGSYVPAANTVFDLVDGPLSGSPTFVFSDSAVSSWDTTSFLVDGSIKYLGTAGGFSAWASANAPGQTMDQDHDFDGVSNGIEYFMGASGSGFTALPAPVGLTITWPMSATYAGTYGTHYAIETSSSLATGSWVPVPLGQVTISPGTSVSYTLPTGQGKVFARLLVTGP